MSSLVSRPHTTLADVLSPRQQRSWLLDVVLVVLFSAFVALTAQVEIPLWPVPLTLQTLGVLFTGAVLGSRRGALALLLYLTEGALGLPVFAGGASGVGYMLGPTGGYLVGFVVAAGVVGWLAQRGWDRRLVWAAVAMVIGNVIIYVCGVAWLAVFLGDLWGALVKGMLLFVVGDLIKIAVAALTLPGGWKLARRRDSLKE
ncbi:MAG: biotin transporter BioY [Actinomycetota bacterium]|jgi:biotin transport system substrate-specific component|nr:biotin transporter BioY [Actinomycetota bacterium]